MEIKICGLTREKEAEYLNRMQADYAGFVFFEKSKRNVTTEQAERIIQKLDRRIQTVAVTVSPTAEEIRNIQTAGFDVLQVHKVLSEEALAAAKIPVWYAFNVSDSKELMKQKAFFERMREDLSGKITGIVVDSSVYGSGVTFDWEKSKYLKKSRRLKKAGAQSPPGDPALPEVFEGRKFILAGGLTPENVAEGIRLFEPDVVDVSSGVEKSGGKDETLVREFVLAVRER